MNASVTSKLSWSAPESGRCCLYSCSYFKCHFSFVVFEMRFSSQESKGHDWALTRTPEGRSDSGDSKSCASGLSWYDDDQEEIG